MVVKRTDRIGAWAEHAAIAHYLNLGWDVFVSVSPGSPIDLIILRDGQARYLDVKYRRSYKPSGRRLSEVQMKLGVELIHVMDSGKVIDKGLA